MALRGTLTARQRAQRKYAAAMRGIRKRAGKARGGRGLIAKRAPAAKLRRKLGLRSKGGRVAKRTIRRTTRRVRKAARWR